MYGYSMHKLGWLKAKMKNRYITGSRLDDQPMILFEFIMTLSAYLNTGFKF